MNLGRIKAKTPEVAKGLPNPLRGGLLKGPSQRLRVIFYPPDQRLG